MGTAVKLREWAPGTDPATAPSPGTGGWYPLAAIAEPISAGAPPVTPALVERMQVTYPARTGRTRSGHVYGQSLASVARPTVQVNWGPMTKAERDLLLAFFRDDCGWTEKGFDLEPDGPDTGVVKVRALGVPEFVWIGPDAHTASLTAEEVF